MCSCGQIQTVEHDFWQCDINRRFRSEYGLDEQIVQLQRDTPHATLWHSGWIENPCLSFPPPAWQMQVHWEKEGENGCCFDLPGYGDGSGKYAHIDVSIRRCGWSVVAADLGADDIINRGAWAWGPLPMTIQTTPAAEVYAFYMYLLHAVAYQGQYHFHSDCAYVVDSWARGKHALVNGWVQNCNLWRKIFAKAEDIGIEHICLHKVKAHRHLSSAIDPYDKMQIQANGYADKGAKNGVELHLGSDSLRGTIKDQKALYRQVLRYLVRTAIKNIELKPKDPERYGRIKQSPVTSFSDKWQSRYAHTFLEHRQQKMAM